MNTKLVDSPAQIILLLSDAERKCYSKYWL